MSSFWSGSSANPSLAWSLGNAGKGRFHIRFPLNLGWYHEQSCTRFRSLQHRKEHGGLQHEFIVLRFVDGSICRIERMGDPEARFNAISANGSTAYDMAQSFTKARLSDACLSTSDVVAKVEFPHELDLMDVLRICRAIHEGEKTCNYTLQSYNCYFFTLAIQAVLTRLVAGWKEVTSDTWNLSLDEGLSALSRLYKETPSSQAQWPFILRIYSLLGPETQWPANLLPHLKHDLLNPELVREVNRACTAALWYSDLELAVDHVLCEKVRDTTGRILHGQEVGGISRDLGTSSTGNVELAFAESQCRELLSVLVSRAVSRHKQERPTSKLKRLWGHMNLFRAFGLFSSAAQSLRNLDFRRARKPRLTERPSHLDSSSAQEIPGWLIYTKSLAMWTLLVALGLFWIVPLDFMQPCRGVSVEEELEQTLLMLELPTQSRCTTDLTPMIKKLRSLVNMKEPVLWREWPWAHAYEPIKRRVTELVLNEEKNPLRVAFQNSDTQIVSLSLFQKYLLNRIRLHSQRVESFKLGRAIHIQDDLEDKLSQVWVLVRDDDTIAQNRERSIMAGPRERNITVNARERNIMVNPKPNAHTMNYPKISRDTAPIWRLHASTEFTRRVGSYIFPAPTASKGFAFLVNSWHKNVHHQLDIVYKFVDLDLDHAHGWEATPIIMGEEHPQYAGRGTSKPKAQEASAQRIAESGHC